MLVQSCLTVLFEEPFWIGLYERRHNGYYEVCKITFGVEPKISEVYNFLLQNWPKLRFAKTLELNTKLLKPPNPKRMQREISKQLQTKTISTKAQQALQQQREESKIERKDVSRQDKEAEQERQFILRQAKKKAKHRGR